jgi:hypothetical protein
MKFVRIGPITHNVPVLASFCTKVLGVKAEGDDVHVELKTKGADIAIFPAEGMEHMAPRSMQGAGYGGNGLCPIQKPS